MKKFLLDEHIPLAYRPQMIRQAQAIQPESDLIVWAIGDPGAPGKGTLDPDLLRWCEAQGFALVTNNRRSMPGHLNDHLAAGGHISGIFIVNLEVSIGRMVDDLILIAFAAREGDFADRITFLPFT